MRAFRAQIPQLCVIVFFLTALGGVLPSLFILLLAFGGLFCYFTGTGPLQASLPTSGWLSIASCAKQKLIRDARNLSGATKILASPYIAMRQLF